MCAHSMCMPHTRCAVHVCALDVLVYMCAHSMCSRPNEMCGRCVHTGCASKAAHWMPHVCTLDVPLDVPCLHTRCLMSAHSMRHINECLHTRCANGKYTFKIPGARQHVALSQSFALSVFLSLSFSLSAVLAFVLSFFLWS